MKTALITFHAPYNYGSCLQAFALQRVIKNMGHQNVIINYRFQGQKDAYKLIRHANKVDTIKDLLQIPVLTAKKMRCQKFEKFMSDYYEMTDEICEPEELLSIKNDYDLFISGSDQIWNKHANELHSVDWKYLYPYLLNFTDKKKISYASSLGGTTNEEIRKYMLHEMEKFFSISARESSVAKRLGKLLKKQILTVLDPTLLLDLNDYQAAFDFEDKSDDYIFYYSLSGINTVNKHLEKLKVLSRAHSCKVIVNTPYAFVPVIHNMKNIVDIGPIEFLKYINNARFIITDSFHGTAFSINFHKNFYSICKTNGASEYRKQELLDHLGLGDRIVYDIDFPDRLESINDYTAANTRLDGMRKCSLQYLHDNIN